METSATIQGPSYTQGTSYRARAERRQREFRAQELGVSHGTFGHFLAASAAKDGSNFVMREAFEAARARQEGGKGVAPRTFENMLSSQAMCFNIFAPLSTRLELALEVLRELVPGLQSVHSITIEHTPAPDIFGDQSGRGGVDCDLLIEGLNTSGDKLVLVVETKFVEPDFSRCGFRRPGRAAKGLDVCAEAVRLREDRGACLYEKNKGYQYWQRTEEHELLRSAALPAEGCPFGGSLWQLWVNYVLAHEEAKRCGAKDARFAVCTSSSNRALLREGAVLDEFRALLNDPEGVQLIDLEQLLERIAAVAPEELGGWAAGLVARYQGI